MQDYNDNNNNIRRMPNAGGSGKRGANGKNPSVRPSESRGSAARPSNGEGAPVRRPSQGQPRPQGQPRSAAQGGRPPVQGRPPQGQPRPSQGQPRPAAQGGRPVQGSMGQVRRPEQGPQRRPQGQERSTGPNDRVQRDASGMPNRNPGGNGSRNGNSTKRNVNGNNVNTGNVDKNRKKSPKKNLPPKKAAKKKTTKIILFVAEIFLLLILVGALWAVNKAQNIQLVKIEDEKVAIDPGVKESIQKESNSKKGYRNVALFGVDSRNKQLDKSTRTDVIMVASINLDTKEVRLVSVYRDTWLNMSTDKYSKANAAYSQGGPEQAISMLNMNLDLDITDFVTVGFDALIDVIDAVGGVEIDVKEAEVVHINSYQKSMVGKVVGKNEAGEDMFDAVPYVEYTPVEHAGLQTLNGLQATAYCRIRYVGDDFQRTERQRTVLTLVAKKAMTLNPSTLNKIAESVASEMATSLDMSEILSLLSGIADYKIGVQSGFPFEDYRQTGRVGSASVVIPVDLTKNVRELHKFLFDKENYEPSDTVKKCSQKISSDTGVSYSGE